MAALGFELFYRFIWGSIIVLTFVSRKESSERFLRIAFYIILGTTACALLLSKSSGSTAILSLLLTILGFFFYTFFSARHFRILGFSCYALAPLLFFIHKSPLHAVNFIIGSMVFGGTFAAQYLGHWFLNVPGLKLAELRRVVDILTASLILRGVGVGIAIFFAYKEIVQFDFFSLLIVISRLLWGILAPLFLVFLVRQTVNMRSTQSATGILYAMSVMLIIGEAAALFLNMSLGWWSL